MDVKCALVRCHEHGSVFLIRHEAFAPHYSRSLDNAGYFDDVLGKTGPCSRTPCFSVSDLVLVGVEIFRSLAGGLGALASKVKGF